MFEFTAPSVYVNAETHQAILYNYGGARAQLRLVLADAAREICRSTLEGEDSNFDFRTDPNNCNDYDPATIQYEPGVLQSVEYDAADPPTVLPLVCSPLCLIDNCTYDDTGDFDPPPEHPLARTVACECKIESIGDCVNEEDDVWYSEALEAGFVEHYCVPEGALPADYCRTSIADYFNASTRAVSYYTTYVVSDPPAMGTCGDWAPSELSLKVTCIPKVAEGGEPEEEGIEAYTDQCDGCSPGCSELECDELWVDPYENPCAVGAGPELSSDCDCDIIPSNCYENGVVMPGVCIPEQIGGADDGSGDGGGSGRLRSALSVLAGDWERAEAQNYSCSQLEPGGWYVPTEGNPPSGTASPYALTNGTSFTTGLRHTCPAPSTNDVEISTFDTSLEELCRLIPLCNASSDLELTITASENETLLASGTLEKSGTVITTTEAGAPLSVGDHTVDLCVEHRATEVEGCIAQAIRASAPLGSGVDGHGYFAGELAADFIPIASKPGKQSLSLSDNGYGRVSLPSGFTFPFYGSAISTYLYVGANGGINTTNAPIAAGNTHLPASSSVDAPDIAVYWDDLDPSSGGGVHAWFDGMRFIVSWEGVPHGRDGSSSTSNGVSVQAHIYESGRIEFHYLDTDVGDADYDHGKSATIGIGNLAGTQAVEVNYDSNALLTSDVVAVGIQLDTVGCLADGLIIPPEVACTANDHYLTVCSPSEETVNLPLPDVSACASGSVGVAGRVIESGSKESLLAPLSTSLPIDAQGNVELDEGVHRIQWVPVDGEDEQMGPGFTQLVFVRTWVHDECSSSFMQSMVLLTDDDDTHSAFASDALAIIGRSGVDVLTSAEGDDFIGDGPDDGICEANEGDDRLVGEDGDDTLDCGPGDDRAWGGSGDDLLIGGDGIDSLYGQDGHDILYGDAHDDALWGGLGDDVLEGGDGADTLFPGAGVDAVYGGAGDDTIAILSACELTNGKLLSGGSGTDVLLLPPGLDLSAVLAAGVTVDADIESVQTSTELPTHRATCEPS